MPTSNKPLATYMHDHLAGAAYALDLVGSIRDNFRGQELGEFAASLGSQIAADKDVLHLLAGRFGQASDIVKDSAAWLAEKISRFKLAHDDPTGLGLFEALEFLALGIHGKAAMWRALSEIKEDYDGFAQIDFASLVKRAEDQEQAVEKFRVIAARRALAPTGSAQVSPPR